MCLAMERQKADNHMKLTAVPKKKVVGDVSFPRSYHMKPAFLLPKKSPPLASIPTNYHEDLSDDDNDEIAGADVPQLGQKRKQKRRYFGKKKQRYSGTASHGQKESALGLSPQKIVLLNKYISMDQSPGAALANLMDDLQTTEELGRNSDEEQPEFDWEDSSQEELVFYGPQDQYQNAPFVWPEDLDNPPGIPQNPANEVDDHNNDNVINIHPNTKMRDDFKEYCRKGRKFLPKFTKAQARSVRLMATLKRRSALSTYDSIMEWHHRENGDINDRETLKHVQNTDVFISRKHLVDFLTKRYNMTGKGGKNSTVHLPNSKAKVVLTTHNAWHCIESLLTDPRINDADFNFHNNDPFAPPPPLGKIGDLHTGKAYYVAYQKFIKFPGRQVLLPITMYIDGAVTGQFANLPITALKIALGIHTRKHRDKDQAWRTLGYVGQVSKASSRGKHIFKESRHLDADFLYLSDDEGGVDQTKDVCKAQDFHVMLDRILETFVEVQKNGFFWDLRYRGKTYKDIEFVPFVIFIKCDTDEADLLCGSYKSRGAGVAQLCRYCTCPTVNSDLVLARYPRKTTPTIKQLVEAQDFEGLRLLSQQMIQNAWYKMRFHPENTAGVHGACPSEMLHALLLGIFKYLRECFFEQIGHSSQLAAEINALAQQYGLAFGRQSERDMPKCQFKQGIVKGKLMAKEFRGILLVIAAVLRSDKGRDLLRSNPNFKNTKLIQNWVLLVETVLEWEAYLNEHEMEAPHVIALSRKNRYIMYLIKKVARRSAGMGLKLMKFHVIVHMWFDIYLYGVPLEVDTGSNESGHKITKIAARLTQKNEATFDFQTCTRLDEFFLFDLASAELEEGRQMWNYYDKDADPPPREPPPHPPPFTSGETMWVYQDDKYGKDPVFSMGVGPESRQPCALEWDNDLVSFLFELQKKLAIEKLEIRGQHKREGMTFRGHPDYREKPWRDYAMIDWGEDSQLPGQIWCFVVIQSIKRGQKPIKHGDVTVGNETYAVIECLYPDERDSEKKKSDLFLPMNKQVRQFANKDVGWRRKFLLADVEAITRPLVVVPNIGGKKGVEYFVVKQRQEWVGIFKKWLDDPHINDVIGADEPVPAHHIAPQLPLHPGQYLDY